jgi:ATP-dependent Clp protease adaptor protein ClpS
VNARAEATPTTTPDVGVLSDEEVELLKRLLPRYRVILHNDDHNAMDHVVQSLIKSVPELEVEQATRIMMDAHLHGKALVTVKPKETAELYAARLTSFGLTATIEADR